MMRWIGLPPAVVRLKVRMAEYAEREAQRCPKCGGFHEEVEVQAIPLPRELMEMLQRRFAAQNDDDIPPGGKAH